MRSIRLAVLAPLLLASTAPAPHYAVVHGWPVLPPGRLFGPCSGCIWPNSEHGIYVDHNDNIYLAGNAGQAPANPVPWSTHKQGGDGFILKFDRDGNFKMRIGGTPTAPDSNDTNGGWNGTPLMYQPADMVVDPKTNRLYVADGYGNSRVMKFAADGRLLFQWGTRGTGPGQFDIPHALAIDAGHRVYVADRANDRVQLFDGKGRYLAEWKSPSIGRPFGLALLPGRRIAILDGGTNSGKVPDHDGVTIAGLDGREVAHFGGIGNQDGQFRIAHDIAADRAGNLYVVDIAGQRVQKFVRR